MARYSVDAVPIKNSDGTNSVYDEYHLIDTSNPHLYIAFPTKVMAEQMAKFFNVLGNEIAGVRQTASNALRYSGSGPRMD